MNEELITELYALYDHAIVDYRTEKARKNGNTEFEAGIVEGVRLAIKALEAKRVGLQ